MTETGTGSGANLLFRSVDVAAFTGGLLRRLRHAGVQVGPSAANRLALAMDCCPPADVNTLYWLTKTTLINDRRDFQVFDQVFDALFGGIGLPITKWERETGRASVKTEGSLLRQSSPADGFALMEARVNRQRPEVVEDNEAEDRSEDDSIVPELLPSALSELVDTPFDQLSSEQLAEVGRWLEHALADLPTRISRRHRVASTGGIDLRRTMRSARTTGEIMTLIRRRQKRKPRPLAMLADVSGSMESFSRIYLHLMRALVINGGLQNGPSVEVFTFATSLRRATVHLRNRDPEEAIARLSDEVVDRFGGTRIASSLGQLLRTPAGHRRSEGQRSSSPQTGGTPTGPMISGEEWLGWNGSPTASSGSTPGMGPRTLNRRWPAWRRPYPMSTVCSAVTHLERWPRSSPPSPKSRGNALVLTGRSAWTRTGAAVAGCRCYR